MLASETLGTNVSEMFAVQKIHQYTIVITTISVTVNYVLYC